MSESILDDVTVIDLGQLYNGAYCSLLLAHLGADVIKVEPPWGEPLRERVVEGEPPELVMLNSSKRGITLNLKADRGKDLFRDLVRDADVLVENYGVGTMDALGLGYEDLSAINPGLVYAHSSGFGESGPKREMLAMDLIVQAVGGVMDVTGFPDGPPVKTGIAPADFLGGTHLFGGIMTALYEREHTGEGQFVETGMYDAIYPSLMSQLGALYKDEDIPHRTGNRHSGLAHCPYNVYETSDGHVALLCSSNAHWESLLRTMGREDLLDEPGYASNVERLKRMDEIDTLVEEWTVEHTREGVVEDLRDAGVPVGPVQTIDEVHEDEHLWERNMIVDIDHPAVDGSIGVPGTPIRLSKTGATDVDPSPTKGRDNHEVYGEELGLAAEEIETLEADGVI